MEIFISDIWTLVTDLFTVDAFGWIEAIDVCRWIEAIDVWRWVTALAAICTIIISITTLKQNIAIRKEELESKRPYFVLEAPGFKKTENSNIFRLQINMKNIGERPAECLILQIAMFEQTRKEQSIFDIRKEFANPIVKDNITPYYINEVQLADNVHPCFIKLKLHYRDNILNKTHEQTLVLKWDGVKNSFFYPDFCHPTKSEFEEWSKHVQDKLNW